MSDTILPLICIQFFAANTCWSLMRETSILQVTKALIARGATAAGNLLFWFASPMQPGSSYEVLPFGRVIQCGFKRHLTSSALTSTNSNFLVDMNKGDILHYACARNAWQAQSPILHRQERHREHGEQAAFAGAKSSTVSRKQERHLPLTDLEFEGVQCLVFNALKRPLALEWQSVRKMATCYFCILLFRT